VITFVAMKWFGEFEQYFRICMGNFTKKCGNHSSKCVDIAQEIRSVGKIISWLRNVFKTVYFCSNQYVVVQTKREIKQNYASIHEGVFTQIFLYIHIHVCILHVCKLLISEFLIFADEKKIVQWLY
jgi:hypothetical protein